MDTLSVSIVNDDELPLKHIGFRVLMLDSVPVVESGTPVTVSDNNLELGVLGTPTSEKTLFSQAA